MSASLDPKAISQVEKARLKYPERTEIRQVAYFRLTIEQNAQAFLAFGVSEPKVLV